MRFSASNTPLYEARYAVRMRTYAFTLYARVSRVYACDQHSCTCTHAQRGMACSALRAAAAATAAGFVLGPARQTAAAVAAEQRTLTGS